MKFFGDSDELSVVKRALDGLAGVCVRRDFELYVVSHSESRARPDEAPIYSFDGKVLAGGSDLDRMTFRLERVNPLEGVNADGSL